MVSRTAYLLTTDKNSERTLFSQDILKKIGFTVKLVQHTPHSDFVVSNKISMMGIYTQIYYTDEPYAYVFEDDINMLEDITLDEIVEYEAISPMFFYLGLCKLHESGIKNTNIKINNHDVISISGGVRGLHAIGLSREGAKSLLKFILDLQDNNTITSFYKRFMDVTLEAFSKLHPAHVVRYDLESYIPGHRGVLFQDRNRFPSNIP